MATLTNIKDALSFPVDETTFIIKDGRTLGDAEVARIQAWFESVYATDLLDENGDPRSATANDFAAWLWGQIAGQVKQWEKAAVLATHMETLPEEVELMEAV